MLRLISPELLANRGINIETSEVTVTATRTGDDLSLVITPAPDQLFQDAFLATVRESAFDSMEEGVAYVATGNGSGPSSFAATIDGTPVDTAVELDPVTASLHDVVATAVPALVEAVGLFSQEADFSATLATASATGLQYAVNNDRSDLLAPGVRQVACHCGRCSLDRQGRKPSVELVGVMIPTFNCGNAYFGVFAGLFEQQLEKALPALELSQLRRLKIELAAEGAPFTVTLPEGDQGEPSEGTVLYAEPPPQPERPRRSLQGLLGRLLSGEGGGGVMLIDPDGVKFASFEEILGGESPVDP